MCILGFENGVGGFLMLQSLPPLPSFTRGHLHNRASAFLVSRTLTRNEGKAFRLLSMKFLWKLVSKYWTLLRPRRGCDYESECEK